MKKIITLSFLALLVIITASCDKETVLASGNIPNEIEEYVEEHFPNSSILQVVKEIDGLKKTYEVILSDNYQLEFNSKREITDIKGTQELPNSVIPVPISDYVDANYPHNIILSWELDRKYQEIKLDNELELQFTLAGDFLRLDD